MLHDKISSTFAFLNSFNSSLDPINEKDYHKTLESILLSKTSGLAAIFKDQSSTHLQEKIELANFFFNYGKNKGWINQNDQIKICRIAKNTGLIKSKHRKHFNQDLSRLAEVIINISLKSKNTIQNPPNSFFKIIHRIFNRLTIKIEEYLIFDDVAKGNLYYLNILN